MLRLNRFLFLAFLLYSHSALFSQIIDLKGSWKFHIGDHSTWGAATFDDSRWGQMTVPAYWEDHGFNGYDGLAWYRKKFDGKKLDKNKTYYLDLGYIDDADEVFLNGKLVGFSGSMRPYMKTAFNVHREYVMPQEAINFDGENVIAIRVNDYTLGGGIIEGSLGIYESQRNKFLLADLQGAWQLSFGESKKEWVNVMVPAFWELTRPGYDGIGWYKRTFMIKSDIPNDQLILLVGKIDDFDEVYLNGVLLGKTNDHLPFGPSKSYQRQRAYAIPAAALNKTSLNTLEIRVEDIGHNGGLYSGIIGIATRSNFEKYIGF